MNALFYAAAGSLVLVMGIGVAMTIHRHKLEAAQRDRERCLQDRLISYQEWNRLCRETEPVEL